MGVTEGSITTKPVIIHNETTIVYANPASLSLLGIESHESILGTSILDLVTQSDRDSFARQCEQVSQKDVPSLGLGVSVTGVETEPEHLIAVSSPVEWDGSDCIQTRLIDTNALLPSGLSADTMDSTPVGISIADASLNDNPHLYVNDGFVELTGYPREEVLGRNCRFLQGPETKEEPVAELRRGITNAEPVTVELRNYRKDGSMFWNRVSVSPITTENGEVTYFLGFQEDISARKAYEQEKELFELQADNVDEVVFITDSTGTIEYVNPQFERKTGYSAQEAIGKNPRLLKSGEQDATFYEELWETITTGEVWESEITNKRKSGERYQVHQRIVPVTNPNGDITHFVAIEEDITESKFIDEILDVMDRVLRHNVRSSLQAIEGYTDVLEQQGMDSDRQDALEAIRQQTMKLDEMSERVRRIRELFQHRNEQHTLPIEIISDFAQEHRDRHPEADIELSLEVPEGVEICNGSLLELAIDEALENAISHNDSPHPHVSVMVQQLVDESAVLITIADNGPGIPENEWTAVTSGRETPLVHGTGIGVWTMYWTLTALGGTMELVENGPQGSIIEFQVPLGHNESGHQ